MGAIHFFIFPIAPIPTFTLVMEGRWKNELHPTWSVCCWGIYL